MDETELRCIHPCCSVTKSCPILCDPMGCSMPDFPVFYYVSEFAQTHAHWVGVPSSHLILCHPLLLLLSIFSSIINWSEVAQSCPTLCNPTDCSLPGSSVRGIFRARTLEWVAISFSTLWISCLSCMVARWCQSWVGCAFKAGRRRESSTVHVCSFAVMAEALLEDITSWVSLRSLGQKGSHGHAAWGKTGKIRNWIVAAIG